MKISVVILAAGLGTRMKSSKPKVLQNLSGQSMILHILKEAFSLSDDVSVVLSHQKERVEAEIKGIYPSTQFLEQDLKAYPGTAGALKNYAPKHEKVLILCGDMPLVLASSLEKLLLSEALSVAVFESAEPKNYGRVIISGNSVEKIVEFKDASDKERLVKTCNAGVYAVNASLLKELLPQISNQNKAGEYYLTDLIALARTKGVKIEPVFVNESEFMGVNDKFELSVAEGLMQTRIKKELMLAGVIMRNPASIFIDSRARFEGECELEENVRIMGACILKNAFIKSGSVIEDSLIENSDIGPLAHIRPKCELKDTHIGNFVECKNARLNGVKAGHLSYLGDCEIASGTNVGCGTITCNYDGLKKHKTIIGKNVFIGSDTQLIAPVKINDEVVIAAGSSVSGEVPKGVLFINRAEKKIVPGFFEKKFRKKRVEI